MPTSTLALTVAEGGSCDYSHQGALITANVDLGCNGLEVNADVGAGDCGGLLSIDLDLNLGNDGYHPASEP